MNTPDKEEIARLMRKALNRRILALKYEIPLIAKFEADIIRGLWRRYNE